MEINNSWIKSPVPTDEAVYTFKKSFCLSKSVKKATLTVSAIGLYKAELNGKKVGNLLLTPGWTSYNHRVLCQAYDVTQFIADTNELDISVAQGWAVGCFTYWQRKHIYADHTSLTALFEILYEDGSSACLNTDESWGVYTSKTRFAEIYHGETIDKTAKIEFIGNAVKDEVKTKLELQKSSFVVEHEKIAPVKLLVTPKGERVLDFGQNMAGYVEVSIKGERGSRIVLHHGEVLDKDGNFYNANYRNARSEMTYILSGEKDVFKPSFSFQGFRYVRLTEYPFDKVDLNSFKAIAIYSDMSRTGCFSCGNDKINQLYSNILWSQRSNFIDIPTDCPQRDERLGWLADAQFFCRTAAINYDVEEFFSKWLKDVALEQWEDGSISGVVPDCQPIRELVSAAWGDAVCIIPWQIYLAYGNKEILRDNFQVMKKWVDYIHRAGDEEFLWLGGLHFGDWMALDAKANSYFGATSNDLIATAFYAYSTDVLVKAGEALGMDMTAYRELYNNIVQAFRSYFIENGFPKEELPYTEKKREDGTSTDRNRKGITQTSLALILHFGLCEEKHRAALAEKLVELIAKNQMRLNTGFVGTPYLLHALSENGYADVAYELLLQEKFPSWRGAANNGATTIWEHWDGIKEDGSFWSANSNSFNHYAYGSVFDWIFGVVCGVTCDEQYPAYKKVHIEPHPDKRLGFADASIQTRNGKLRVRWEYTENALKYEIEIPKGVNAEVKLQSGKTENIGEGIHCFTDN